MKTSLSFASLLVTVTVLFSCNDSESSVDERVDEGELCLSQSEPSVLRVGVAVETCYSSSCSEFLDADCSVEREGTTIVVKSILRVKEWGGECTNDCVTPIPTCKIEGIDAGEYRLVHGEYETMITLPLSDGSWMENADGAWGCAS